MFLWEIQDFFVDFVFSRTEIIVFSSGGLKRALFFH